MGRKTRYVEMDKDTQGVIWDALYSGAAYHLQMAKRHLAKCRECSCLGMDAGVKMYRSFCAHHFGKYRQLVLTKSYKEGWYRKFRSISVEVNANGTPMRIDQMSHPI